MTYQMFLAAHEHSSDLTANEAGSSPCAVSQVMVPNQYIERFHGFSSIKTKFFPSNIPSPMSYSPMCVIIQFADLTLHCSQANLMLKHRK